MLAGARFERSMEPVYGLTFELVCTEPVTTQTPSDGLYAIAIAIADTTVLCINGAIFDVLGAFDCMFAVFAANGPTPSDSRDHETYVAFHLR